MFYLLKLNFPIQIHHSYSLNIIPNYIKLITESTIKPRYIFVGSQDLTYPIKSLKGYLSVIRHLY